MLPGRKAAQRDVRRPGDFRIEGEGDGVERRVEVGSDAGEQAFGAPTRLDDAGCQELVEPHALIVQSSKCADQADGAGKREAGDLQTWESIVRAIGPSRREHPSPGCHRTRLIPSRTICLAIFRTGQPAGRNGGRQIGLVCRGRSPDPPTFGGRWHLMVRSIGGANKGSDRLLALLPLLHGAHRRPDGGLHHRRRDRPAQHVFRQRLGVRWLVHPGPRFGLQLFARPRPLRHLA